jgi:DNA (cytosine-5)-methyltransferase 1
MLPHKVAKNWIWFNPGIPTVSKRRLIDVLSEESTAESWHSKVQTKRLISLMSKRHRAKLRDAKRLKKQVVGTLFLRMRPEQGINRQRAEINFTEVAGCIRTPMGGGSRVRILQVNGQDVRSRLLTPREAARLMGLKSSYKLPAGYEDAFRVLGDGVAPPAVAFVKARILEPVLLSKMC